MSPKNKISTVIITHNEESNIERALQSVLWTDEILIYDGNSDDKTLEICRKYNCNIHIRNEWSGFGNAKREAVNLAKNDIILSLDADEELSKDLILKIQTFSESDLCNFAYKIRRKSYFLGKLIKYSSWQSDYPLRIFNRKTGNFNLNKVHEYVETTAEIKPINEEIIHYAYPNLDIYNRKMLKYAELSAESKYLSGKTTNLLKAIISAKWKFIKMYFLGLGILDGKAGLILAINSAFGVYLKHILLIDKWRRQKKS